MEMLSAEILSWLTHYGYLGIFCLLMLGIVGAPIPDELVLTCAGYMIFKGYLSPGLTAASAFTGSLCGISVSYALGRFIGTPIIYRYGHIVNIKHERLDALTAWYERFGKWALLFGYFIAGVRHLSAFMAGTSRLRLPVFAAFAYTGAFIWSLTFISIGYILGEEWTWVAEHLTAWTWVSLMAIGVIAILLFVRLQKSRRT